MASRRVWGAETVISNITFQTSLMAQSSKWHRSPPFQGVKCGFESRLGYHY